MDNNGQMQQWAEQFERFVGPRFNSLEQELQRLRGELKAMTAGGATGSSANLANLKTATQSIYQQTAQPAALQTLAQHAAQFAPRVLLFVIKGTNALGWIGHGFDKQVEAGIRNLSISLNGDSVLRGMVVQPMTKTIMPGSQPGALTFLEGLGKVTPQQAAMIPLLVRGKVAGVLYADSGTGGEVSVEALEILSAACGVAIELIMLGGRKDAPSSTASSIQASLRTTGDMLLPAAEPSAPPAPAPAAPPAAASGPASSQENEDAQRLARLLVREVVLYNEAVLGEARQAGDIYGRLREDIDRSRAHYDQRVAPGVTEDYFYAEMVAVLGEGDPSRLGANCPGPRARA